MSRRICSNCFAPIWGKTCRRCGHSTQRRASDYDALPVGTRLNSRYITGRLLGRGGFGMIYLAYDEKEDRTVALKEYYPDGAAVRGQDNITVEPMTTQQSESYSAGLSRFYQEAEIISRFRESSQIIGIYDVFEANGSAYYAMEYVQGTSLEALTKERSKLAPEQAVYIAVKLLPALDILHKKNILHRDVSPDNILLKQDGGVRLIDFGAARVLQDAGKSLSVILKQGFAPLEQYQRRGNQGGWTDIYSLGASLFYCLTGTEPEDPLTRLDDDTPFRLGIRSMPERLGDVITRACALKPENRFQDAGEMLEAVRGCGVTPCAFSASDIHIAEPQIPAAFRKGWTDGFSAPFISLFRDRSPIKVKIGGVMYPIDSVKLDLDDRQLTIAQIQNLRHMSQLVSLNLMDNYITDLSCLKKLTQLEDIHFSYNNVHDIEFMTGMNMLRTISAENTGITDISPLEGKTRLESVFIGDSYVTDISPLKSARGLRYLGCNELQIGNLDALEGMTELETICLAGCNLTSIEPLSSAKKLKKVYLGRNRLTDLSPLRGCDIQEMYVDLNCLEGHPEAFDGLTVNGFVVLNGNGFTQKDLERIAAGMNGDFELDNG